MTKEDIKISCARALLMPVVRFALRHSVSVQQMIELLKEGVVRAAAEELDQLGEKANTSRLSARTGMHRRDVARLYSEQERPPLPSTISARIVAQWESDSRFHGANGKPRILSIKEGSNGFSHLVQLVGTDLNVGTVLFDLERSGAVERTPNGVKLKRGHALVREELLDGVRILADDWEDSVRTVEGNILSRKAPPDLHGRTEFDNIPPKHETEIRNWLLAEGGKFHQKIRRYLARFDRDFGRKGQDESDGSLKSEVSECLRIAIGTYSRIEHVQQVESNQLCRGD